VGSRDTVDGWFRTGDAGHLDSDGYLYVLDRRDDLIISGGENVYPAEIERVLREHRSVLDAGVIGVEDESWGSRPVAAVVWSGGPDQAGPELLRHCQRRLSGYKIPDRFVLLSELPRSPSGKLLRRVLREMIGESPRRIEGKL
jgi:o-succinylbenzoate---CoA ligase